MSNIIEHMILYCFLKLDGERSTSSVYHLLNGKKSSQTIQDAHLFSLSQFYSVAPSLTRERYSNIVHDFYQKGLLVNRDSDRIQLTPQGKELAQRLFVDYPFLIHLNGWVYQNGRSVWERISLLTQVLSNVMHDNKSYIPIQRNRDTQKWVKAFLLSNKGKLTVLANKLLCELQLMLERQEIINPVVFVMRLSGYKCIGVTEKQASDVLGVNEDEYHFQFQVIIHLLIKEVNKRPMDFPLLKGISTSTKEKPLTTSTQKTYQLLKSGLMVDEISRIRNLKLSTIHDHLVEITLMVKNFDISPYVSESLQKDILLAIKQASSKQLKNIRQLVEADYFQIRLTMAKFGDTL